MNTFTSSSRLFLLSSISAIALFANGASANMTPYTKVSMGLFNQGTRFEMDYVDPLTADRTYALAKTDKSMNFGGGLRLDNGLDFSIEYSLFGYKGETILGEKSTIKIKNTSVDVAYYLNNGTDIDLYVGVGIGAAKVGYQEPLTDELTASELSVKGKMGFEYHADERFSIFAEYSYTSIKAPSYSIGKLDDVSLSSAALGARLYF